MSLDEICLEILPELSEFSVSLSHSLYFWEILHATLWDPIFEIDKKRREKKKEETGLKLFLYIPHVVNNHWVPAPFIGNSGSKDTD